MLSLSDNTVPILPMLPTTPDIPVTIPTPAIIQDVGRIKRTKHGKTVNLILPVESEQTEILHWLNQLKSTNQLTYDKIIDQIRDKKIAIDITLPANYLLYALFAKTDDLLLLKDLVQLGLGLTDINQSQILFMDIYQEKNLYKFQYLTKLLGPHNVRAICKLSMSDILRCQWKTGLTNLCWSYININMLNADKKPMLWYAVANQDIQTVRYLLYQGANPDIVVDNVKFIGYSFDKFFDKEIIQLLLSFSAKMDDIDKYYQDTYGENVLKRCIDNELIDNIHFLGANGYNMDLYNSDGKHYLIDALCRGYISIANALIPYCKVFCPINDAGDSILHYCIDNCYLDSIKLIVLNKNFDINCVQNDGKTALRYALARNYCDRAQILINAGADINIRGKDGCAGLSLAVYHGHFDSVKLAIASGADINNVDADGKSVLYTACSVYEWGHAHPQRLAIIELLLEAGAHVSREKVGGKSMFDYVEDSEKITKLLQKYETSSCKKLVDDEGNEYEPIVNFRANAVCEVDVGSTDFPQYQLICCPVGNINYRQYDETSKMWDQFSLHKIESGLEIQFTSTETLKYHVMTVSGSKIRLQFDEICLPNGEKYQFKYY